MGSRAGGDARSTGSAVRAGFKGTPGVGCRALTVTPGTIVQNLYNPNPWALWTGTVRPGTVSNGQGAENFATTTYGTDTRALYLFDEIKFFGDRLQIARQRPLPRHGQRHRAGVRRGHGMTRDLRPAIRTSPHRPR